MPVQKGFIWLLLLLPAAVCSYAQQGAAVVSGIIKSENGETLQGAVVKVENRSTAFSASATSNAKGLFAFNALPVGGPYSFIINSVGFLADTLNGYMAKENGRISLSVVLKTKSQNLDNIVVVGYGRSSKATITGAITSVKSEDFNQGVFNNPMQLLQGKVAGINITKSGNPNDAPGVVLRGPSSFRAGAQEPFYVIDGVPGASLFLVAPEDIVSIDVLKDASSTAIYGSRAANGVIIVTTRKARPGQSRLSYNAYTGIENISNTIEMATGDQLRAYTKAKGITFKQDATDLDKTVYSADDGSNTNWQKEVTRTGISHNHNLGFMGSTDNTDYAASVNYLSNQGIIRNSSMERFIVRGSLGYRAFDSRLKLTLNVTNSTTNGKEIPSQVYNNMLTYLPVTGVRNAKGAFREDISRTPGSMPYYNPVSLIENNTLERKTSLSLINGSVRAGIVNGLDFTTMVSLQDEKIDYNAYYNRASMLAQNLNGKAVRTTINNTKKVLESFFNYDKHFGYHGMKLLAGYSWQEDKTGNGFGASNSGFITDDMVWNNLGLGDRSQKVEYGDIYIKTLRIISFYGRLNYDYKGKYLFQASLRRDGSSAFGANNKWGMFPAVSAGWNITDEDFMRNLSFINNLKLRAGYGVSGNSAGFDPFIAVELFRPAASQIYYDGRYVNSIGTFQNGNPNLKWERTGMVNIGIDFSVFRNIVSGSLDVYDKRTSDLIGSYRVPASAYPFPTLLANTGKMSNKGIELTLNITPVKTQSFSWTTSVNLAHNVNKVLSISKDAFRESQFYTATDIVARSQSNISGFQIIKEGQPLGTFYTLKYAGKNANGTSTFYDKSGKADSANNKFEFFDITGSAQPKLLYGWNNSFRYKQFDLNFFFRGVTGNKILNATRAYMSEPASAGSTNIPVETLAEAKDVQNGFLSDRYLESGSYLRLDNATIGYTLKTKQHYSFRFFASGNNLFIITDYKGMDPEINMSGQTPGIDNSNFYPKTRSFLFGVSVVF